MLDAPDPATRDGVRDRAMLHLAVCAGLRVSELTGLKLRGHRPVVDEHSCSGQGTAGTGAPLVEATAAALRAWLAVRGRVATPEVFVNARGEPLTDGASPICSNSMRQPSLGRIPASARNASRHTSSGTHAQ